MLIQVTDNDMLKISVCESEDDYRNMCWFFNHTVGGPVIFSNGGFDVTVSKEEGKEFFELFDICDKDGDIIYAPSRSR